jgi:hypothetical protein
MSTEISKVGSILRSSSTAEDGRISLTQFYGGPEHGICIQVSESNVMDSQGHSHWIQLTLSEAIELANNLAKWTKLKQLAKLKDKP